MLRNVLNSFSYSLMNAIHLFDLSLCIFLLSRENHKIVLNLLLLINNKFTKKCMKENNTSKICGASNKQVKYAFMITLVMYILPQSSENVNLMSNGLSTILDCILLVRVVFRKNTDPSVMERMLGGAKREKIIIELGTNLILLLFFHRIELWLCL